MAITGALTTAPLSLFLELMPDTSPDLEVVARASIAFAELARELAFLIDPSIDIRVEFDSGTPSNSLNINAKIRQLGTKATDPKTIMAVVLAVTAYFRHEITDWTTHRVLDRILGTQTQEQHGLSETDIQKISENVAKLLKSKGGAQQAQQVYGELERDTSITGVGASPALDQKPTDIIPRQEFAARGTGEVPVESAQRKRKTPYSGRLTLVSPVLLNRDRRWKFKGPQGEFGAYVDDDVFVQRVLAGKVRMAEGMQLNVTMETTEEFDGRVWRRVEAHILRVKSVRRPLKQSSLPLAPAPDSGSKDKQ